MTNENEIQLGAVGINLPVYSESELDSKLSGIGYALSDGFFSQNQPLNQLTIQSADHFILEAIAAQKQPWVLSKSFSLPFFGKITILPNVLTPVLSPVFTYYKQPMGSPATKIIYTIITSDRILIYNLPVQPAAAPTQTGAKK